MHVTVYGTFIVHVIMLLCHIMFTQHRESRMLHIYEYIQYIAYLIVTHMYIIVHEYKYTVS